MQLRGVFDFVVGHSKKNGDTKKLVPPQKYRKPREEDGFSEFNHAFLALPDGPGGIKGRRHQGGGGCRRQFQQTQGGGRVSGILFTALLQLPVRTGGYLRGAPGGGGAAAGIPRREEGARIPISCPEGRC
jgi:hypothetical protein